MNIYKTPEFWSFGRRNVIDTQTLERLRAEWQTAVAANKELYALVSPVLKEAHDKLNALGLVVKSVVFQSWEGDLYDTEAGPDEWTEEWNLFERVVRAHWEDRKKPNCTAAYDALIAELKYEGVYKYV